MDIRSVTVFSHPDFPPDDVAEFLAEAREAFPFPVQTTRLATPPFPEWWPEQAEIAVEARRIADWWREQGVDYISLGPVELKHDSIWIERIVAILKETDILFATAVIADEKNGVDLKRAGLVGQLIKEISLLQDNGFGNLYFTALANCPAGSPFFPVAYHDGGEPAFALAIEAADLAVEAIRSASSLTEARANLIEAIESSSREMVAVAERLARKYQLRFTGLDFSLAPYPTDDKSLAGAMEEVGLAYVGAPGSLFAAGFITEAIGRAEFPRTGFSGLMLPVLEDSILARRVAAGQLQLADLVSYAAVCGVGLDTIPLAGDIAVDSLTGILLDLGMLSLRLRKPLTARLMPLPGLKEGDEVRFDFPYFADSRVMGLANSELGGMLRGGRLMIEPIHPFKEG